MGRSYGLLGIRTSTRDGHLKLQQEQIQNVDMTSEHRSPPAFLIKLVVKASTQA